MEKRGQSLMPLEGKCVDTSIIQKSYPLLSLWKSPLTLQELKILDTYLARIDSHNPEYRWVRFQKGELENILGVKRIRTDELKERLRNLCIVVNLEDPTASEGFRAITLFEQMVCSKDENGLWQVDLQCTNAAMQYIFNVDHIGYLKYRLWAILHLHSRYSYVLFLYIERNSFRKDWDIPLDELRKILRCDTESSYKEFRRFNDRVLKRAQSEIIEKTYCRFSYEKICAGRRVVAIRFHYDGNNDSNCNGPNGNFEQDFQQTLLADQKTQCERSAVNPRRKEAIDWLLGACIRDGKPEFTENETAQILEILRVIPPSKMPKYPLGEDINIVMYHYLSERYSALNRLAEKNTIKNRFSYLIRMLKNDAGMES